MELPVIEVTKGKFKVTENFLIKTSLRSFVVPKGFVTNFATTPEFIHCIYPPRGKYDRATLLHDYFCNPNNRYRVLPEGKKVADKLFLEIMKADKVNLITRTLFYNLVRLKGEAWKR